MEGPNNSSRERWSSVAEGCAALASQIARYSHEADEEKTPFPGLSLYRQTAPARCVSMIYEPQLILLAQGQKRISCGRTTYLCDESNYFLTSVELPVVSQVVRASKQKPLLALAMNLDMQTVRDLAIRDNLPRLEVPSGARGVAAGRTSIKLLDLCFCLLDGLNSPLDIQFRSSQIQHEIVYHLLCCPEGQYLRAIATLSEPIHRTASAIAWLSANYDRPLRIEDLASIAHMDVPTLHLHFRHLTALNPLQYQRRLRIQMARQHMQVHGLDATSAACEVGYESTSQFAREYFLYFGEQPDHMNSKSPDCLSRVVH